MRQNSGRLWGDGTLSEVVPALLNTPTALGLLPFGTANDFARGLGVPRTLSKAVKRARGGTRRIHLTLDDAETAISPPLPPMDLMPR